MENKISRGLWPSQGDVNPRAAHLWESNIAGTRPLDPLETRLILLNSTRNQVIV